MFSVLVTASIIICLRSLANGYTVGCHHCEIEATCSAIDMGTTASALDCFNSYCDADCNGIQFDGDTLRCSKLLVETACTPLQYTSSNIFVYRDLARNDCSLFTLSSYPDYVFGIMYVKQYDTPRTNAECVERCFSRDGCLDLVYKPGWCFIFDNCSASACGSPFLYGYSHTLYRFTCEMKTPTQVSPTSEPSTKITPTSTKMPSTSGASTQISSTSGASTQISSTSGASTQIATTSGTSTKITSTSGKSTQMSSTNGSFMQISSTSGTSTQKSSTSGTFTQMLSTSGTSTRNPSIFSGTSSKATSTIPVTRPIYIWPCLCSNKTFSAKTQEEIIEELVNDVRIDSSSTTLALSKLKCMSDSRGSATSIGIVGIAMLSVVGGLMLLSDLLRCFTCPCCGIKSEDYMMDKN